jgi:hypothetical protein
MYADAFAFKPSMPAKLRMNIYLSKIKNIRKDCKNKKNVYL